MEVGVGVQFTRVRHGSAGNDDHRDSSRPPAIRASRPWNIGARVKVDVTADPSRCQLSHRDAYVGRWKRAPHRNQHGDRRVDRPSSMVDHKAMIAQDSRGARNRSNLRDITRFFKDTGVEWS